MEYQHSFPSMNAILARGQKSTAIRFCMGSCWNLAFGFLMHKGLAADFLSAGNFNRRQFAAKQQDHVRPQEHASLSSRPKGVI